MSPTPLASFAEFENLIPNLPAGDEDAARTAASILKPYQGKAAEYGEWLARWQGNVKPRLHHPRLALFAATYGADPKLPETRELVQLALENKLAANKLCHTVDADLRVYELDIDNPSAAFTNETPAMNEEDCARAIAYGMMAVESGVNLICVSDLSPGADRNFEKAFPFLNNTSAQKSPLQLLAHYGGYDSAAILGTLLAARLARVPVLTSSKAAQFTLLVLNKMGSGLTDHVKFIEANNNAALQDTRTLGLQLIPDLRIAAELLE